MLVKEWLYLLSLFNTSKIILVNPSMTISNSEEGYSTNFNFLSFANNTKGLIILLYASSKTIPLDSKFLKRI